MKRIETPLVTSVTDVIADVLDPASRRTLDVGCGSGSLVRWLAEQGARAVGLESQVALVEAARRQAPVAGERYVHGRGESLPFGNGEFDIVIFSFSLHHVPETVMTAALAEARRVLDGEGVVLVVEPVADGDYFEVMRIVDDETRVRRLALEAVNDHAAHGLRSGPEEVYRMARYYDGPGQFFEQIIRVDPGRRAAVEANRQRLREAFFRHGKVDRQGYRFEMEIRSNLLFQSASEAA